MRCTTLVLLLNILLHNFPSVEAKDLGPVHLTCIKERENETQLKWNLSKQEKGFIKYKPVHDTTWYAAKTIHIHLATNYKLKYSTFWYLIQIIYFFHMCTQNK